MSNKIQSIRGMNDLLPHESHIWQHIECVVADVLNSYGYREIRFPILEQTGLFKRAIGEVTDIVEKEMYTFEDRNGDRSVLKLLGLQGLILMLKCCCSPLVSGENWVWQIKYLCN